MARRYSTKTVKNKRLTGKFFFIDEKLYRVIRTNAPANLIEAWDYEAIERVNLLYSDYRTKAKRAVTTKVAADIMNVSKRTLIRAYVGGHIREPVQSYPIGNQSPNTYETRWWGVHNLLEAHEYFMTVHRGRPRHDGVIVPNQNLPTRAEIIAKMQNETVFYVKGEGDRFIPVYEPPKFKEV